MVTRLKTGTGALLLEGSDASEDDIKNAAGAISQMSKINLNTSASAAGGHSNTSAAVPWHGPAILSSIVAGSSSAAIAKSVGSSIAQAFWSSWEWVKRQATGIKDWFISKVNNAWHFVVSIAGKAWGFILDSWNAVVKAAAFILERLKVAWNAVVDAFGFVFNWGDIKKTKESIKVMVNSCFDFGTAFIANNRPKVAQVFDDMEAAILSGLKLDDLPDDVKNKKQTPANASDSEPAKSNVSSSAPANVGGYHFEQARKSSSRLDEVSGSLHRIFGMIVKPIISVFADQASTITVQVVELLGRPGVSVEDVFKAVGAGLVKLVIGLLKDVVLGLMDVLGDIVWAIKEVLNWTVQIPVITPLLESLGIPEFSLLDVISILLAMPVTVLAKVITGKAPKRIQSFDYSAMVSGTLDKESLLAYNDLASYLTITYYIYDTISCAIKIVTSEVPETPPTISLGSLLIKMIVRAATFPYDTASPGRDWSLAIWTMLTANDIIAAIALKTGLPVAKALAATDILIALSSFALQQVVHAKAFQANKNATENTRTGLSVAKSIYTVLGGVAGGYGIITPDPVEKGIALAVATAANTDVAIISTGDKVIEEKSKK